MFDLTDGRRHSDLQVFPKNWETDPLTMGQKWYIKYRFYDTAYIHPKQVVIKEGINTKFPWRKRIQFVHQLIADEKTRLRNGYNPFTPAYIKLKLRDALELARLDAQMSHNTRIDMKSTLKYFGEAMERLKLDKLSVMHTRRKHVRLILDECYKNSRFTDNTFNHYRKYLQILFKHLVEIEMIDHNPISGITPKRLEFVSRETLSSEEREVIPKSLKDNYYNFWRFVQIFFHSGTRRSEILLVRKRDVNLSKQQFKVIIKKGNKPRIVEKIILDNVLDLWKEVMQHAKLNDYLFSEGLAPGPRSIRPEQVTRRWNKHVKEKLGVTADFYSLKHLHTDLIAEQLSIEAAAEHDSHTSTAVTKKHYAINEKKREQQMRKSLDIRL